MCAMPLTLTPRIVDRSLTQSVAAQLADHFSQALADGDLLPGDVFPSEEEIREATGISRPTVQRALDELEQEGKIVRRKGVRTHVAIPPSVRYWSLDQYARETAALDAGETPRSAFLEAHGARDEDYVVQRPEITRETASALDGEYLGVRKGTPILRRRMLECINSADGKPVPIQIHRQALRYRRFADTELAQAFHVSGILTELRRAGIRPDAWEQWHHDRMPNRTERDLLQMRAGPVREIITTLIHKGKAVHVSKIITPSARISLHVAGQLPPVPGTSAD